MAVRLAISYFNPPACLGFSKLPNLLEIRPSLGDPTKPLDIQDLCGNLAAITFPFRALSMLGASYV